ncbi:SRPBCC family protein [Streptomyces palmae]|uniref:Polyketide cyclase n=1 Tax=Streptomyces palmae TaxID=1701085 RepID=A0A4Z0GYV6_9ACTN|nr:SRPBCC family protein [Streptomyces palmae]TGB03097.1 polyketide cyclase [Streptomyces palmae]
MDWCRYRFRAHWEFDAAPEAVYAVLARAEDYPRWWPQMREVRRAEREAGAARIRSLIPFDLMITARLTREDPAGGVLEVALGGDLEGWARWTVRPRGAGARVLFRQEVVVRKSLLRRLAVPGRPFFRANHALMMRGGHRGLRRELAAGGGRAAAAPGI